MLLPQRSQSLLLGGRVDVGSDQESDEVEERHPCLLGQELLSERERDGRGDPGDFHDGQEAGAHGGAYLVEGAGAGDDGHGGQVDGVLDWRDLDDKRLAGNLEGLLVDWVETRTTRLLTRICKILDFRLVRPANSFCRMLMRTWPMGALMKAP